MRGALLSMNGHNSQLAWHVSCPTSVALDTFVELQCPQHDQNCPQHQMQPMWQGQL